MRVITYFGFTLLSIFLQFTFMDIIQNKLLLDDNEDISFNITGPKKQIRSILKDFSYQPHALYYSAQEKRLDKNNNSKQMLGNVSLLEKQQTSTAAVSTVFDIFRYENTTTTESSLSTDYEYTTTMTENFTEVTLLINNETNTLAEKPAIIYNFDCNCNFLYEVCDVNCCCDTDCSDSDIRIFDCEAPHNKTSAHINDVCIASVLHSGGSYVSSNSLDSLFCIVKTNLPKKRIIPKSSYKILADDQYFKWHYNKKSGPLQEFTKSLYKSGDPVWLLLDTSVYHIELPTPVVNNYCTGRKRMKFLKDETITCNVRFKDLEMLYIVKTSEKSFILSSKNDTIVSALNCSSFHCTNWTVIICDNTFCEKHNKTKHEPTCDEHTCRNIALTVDYILYYYDFTIANVTVTLHVGNIQSSLSLMTQKINVKFIMTNKTVNRIIEYSGTPGYKRNLRILVSYSEGNHTNNFYQNEIDQEKYFLLPVHDNGQCIFPNFNRKFIQFGLNKRIKCRYFHNHNILNVNVCTDLQNRISEMFHLKNKIVISPYGNPYNVSDKDWVPMKLDSSNDSVYGKVDRSLHCYNVISRISFTFLFANIDEENSKILSFKTVLSTKNLSFATDEDISIIVTTDINFVNVSKPPLFEYAGRPHLSIGIPKDFFFPYPSNNCNNNHTFKTMLYCAISYMLFANKIPLSY